MPTDTRTPEAAAREDEAMSEEFKVGEANAGFTKAEPVPRSVELARASMMRFEAQKAAEGDELTAKERAALSALIEWRKADKAMSEYDHRLAVSVMCHESVGLEESRRLAQLKAEEFGKRNALRAAVDELSKG